MKFFILSALLAVAAANAIPYGAYTYGAAPQEIKEEPTYATITKQEDVRNLDGSSKYSYESSDMTTMQESQYQKQIGSATGTAAQGSSSWIAPDGQQFQMSWVADENGYRATGDHLPTPPPVPAEIAAMLPTLPKLTPEQWAAAPAVAAAAAPHSSYEPAKYDAPAYEAPKVAEPKYEEPKYEAPKIQTPVAVPVAPAAPRYEAPKVETPKAYAPKYQAPAAPAPVAPAPAPAKPTYLRYY